MLAAYKFTLLACACVIYIHALNPNYSPALPSGVLRPHPNQAQFSACLPGPLSGAFLSPGLCRGLCGQPAMTR